MSDRSVIAVPRKRKDEPEAPGDRNNTTLIRVNGDLAKMIALVVAWKGTTTAQYLDPMIRDQITADFAEVAAAMTKQANRQRP